MISAAGAMHPNTFLIGAPKCGTTAIARYLADHPQVFVPIVKEPSFWSVDFNRGSTVVKLETLGDYLALFAGASYERVILDASTSYIASDVALPRILQFAPQAKFIVMLRNPVEVSHAYHMEKVFNCFEDVEDFETAWRMQARRSKGENLPAVCPEPKELQYREIAAIGTQLLRVQRIVPTEQLIVLFHEDLVERPRQLWLALEGFLGIEDDGRLDFPPVGAAHFNRFPRLARLYQNPPKALLPLVRILKRAIVASAAEGGMGAHIKEQLISRKKRPPLREEFRRELEHDFAAEITLLETLTGRDLSAWKECS